jgi:hypothetical protein
MRWTSMSAPTVAEADWRGVRSAEISLDGVLEPAYEELAKKQVTLVSAFPHDPGRRVRTDCSTEAFVEQPLVRFHLSILLATVLVVTVATGLAHAQSSDCSIAPRGIGVSMGRSSPYLELSQGAVDAIPSGSILVQNSFQIAARGDLPIAGPWRARVEAAAANWPVVRHTYGEGFEPIARDQVGYVGVRQLVGLIGRQGGRSPVCGYVLAGGGIYSLGFRGGTVRRPGVALTAGIEVPTGEHGAIEADLQLHVINTDGRYPIAFSEVPAAGLMVGWSLRF